MQQIFLSILSIYFFVAIGFAAKAAYKEKINEKTLIYLSVYFLQPMLIFWGITKRPINMDLIYSPLVFLGVVAIALAITYLTGKYFIKDQKDRSIFIFAGLAGNTGNLAIPIGEAVFGPESIPYLTMINIANAIFFYTLGIYFYSRGKSSIKQSIRNIFKTPLIWIALIAITARSLGFEPTGTFEALLTKGAYASIVVQLSIFGMYLYGNHLRKTNFTFTLSVLAQKFLLLPAIGLFALSLTNFEPIVAKSLFLQFLVPLAVNNINFAALFDCKPTKVTQLTFISSILALAILPLGLFFAESLL